MARGRRTGGRLGAAATRTQAGSNDSAPNGGSAAGELSFDEAVDLYRGEWVAMEVLELDADHLPARGRILAHDPSHARLCQIMARIEPPPSGSGRTHYLFHAEHYIRTGAEMRTALEQAHYAEGEGAWRRR